MLFYRKAITDEVKMYVIEAMHSIANLHHSLFIIHYSLFHEVSS